jgi:hypothetical protein
MNFERARSHKPSGLCKSCPCIHFTPGTHQTGGSVDPRAGLNNDKVLDLTRIENSQHLSCPASIQTSPVLQEYIKLVYKFLLYGCGTWSDIKSGTKYYIVPV